MHLEECKQQPHLPRTWYKANGIYESLSQLMPKSQLDDSMYPTLLWNHQNKYECKKKKKLSGSRTQVVWWACACVHKNLGKSILQNWNAQAKNEIPCYLGLYCNRERKCYRSTKDKHDTLQDDLCWDAPKQPRVPPTSFQRENIQIVFG